jgi:hypothetical protein
MNNELRTIQNKPKQSQFQYKKSGFKSKLLIFDYLALLLLCSCALMPFYKSGVNHLANRRCLYRSFNLSFATEDNTQVNPYYPTFLAPLVDSGISQILGGEPASSFRPATFTRGRWRNFSSISPQDGLFIRPVFIRSYQIHHPTTGSFLKILHQFLNIFGSAFARYYANYQTVLKVVSYVVPVVWPLAVIWVTIITAFFFLADKGPLLIELSFSGFWGKTPPIHREAPVRVRRILWCSGLLYLDELPPNGWSYAHHNLQRCALALRPSSHQAVAGQTTVYLFVRKIASCMFDSIAAGYGCFCRTSRIRSNYLPRVFHSQGISYFDNRILKELSLSYLRNVNYLWDNHLSLIPDIGKTT